MTPELSAGAEHRSNRSQPPEVFVPMKLCRERTQHEQMRNPVSRFLAFPSLALGFAFDSGNHHFAAATVA